MSKDTSEKVSLELAFLEALDSIHADVDTSEIGEIQDWSRAVRGKFYGAAVKDASDLSRLKADSPFALGHPNVTNEQYSEMAIPQLIAACTSESSEGAWREFIRRFQPLIATVIAKIARRFGKVSHELVTDLTQDTFIKLCRTDFRILKSAVTVQENSFQKFLKVVATHTAEDYFRRATSSRGGLGKGSGDDRVFLEPLPMPQAASESGKIALFEDVNRALQTLSNQPNFERDYEIFWLYYRNGLTANEISALPDVKLTVKGVESILHRLTRQVRVALKLKTEGSS